MKPLSLIIIVLVILVITAYFLNSQSPLKTNPVSSPIENNDEISISGVALANDYGGPQAIDVPYPSSIYLQGDNKIIRIIYAPAISRLDHESPICEYSKNIYPGGIQEGETIEVYGIRINETAKPLYYQNNISDTITVCGSGSEGYFIKRME